MTLTPLGYNAYEAVYEAQVGLVDWLTSTFARWRLGSGWTPRNREARGRLVVGLRTRVR